MGAVHQFTPARLRRAFFILAGLSAGSTYGAPSPLSTPPPLVQMGKPNPAESARILDQFRQSGWFGYVEFDLRAMPRRGDEVVYKGRLWGGRNDQGAVTRIEVTDAKGAVTRFLLQNGPRPGVWRVTGANVSQLESSALLQPLIPGVEVTAFDLQMPYLYWPDAKVEGVERVRGRPAYGFVFRPPADVKLPIVLVRSFFDAQFNAPVQTELADSRRVLKVTSLVDLKKVGEDWIPKSFDVRDEVTRNKTRFEVTAVALHLEFPAHLFSPAALLEDVRPPAAERMVRITQ